MSNFPVHSVQLLLLLGPVTFLKALSRPRTVRCNHYSVTQTSGTLVQLQVCRTLLASIPACMYRGASGQRFPEEGGRGRMGVRAEGVRLGVCEGCAEGGLHRHPMGEKKSPYATQARRHAPCRLPGAHRVLWNRSGEVFGPQSPRGVPTRPLWLGCLIKHSSARSV